MKQTKGSNKFVDSLVGISLLESDLINNSGTISTKEKEMVRNYLDQLILEILIQKII